jgi:site-specific DNA recombinase
MVQVSSPCHLQEPSLYGLQVWNRQRRDEVLADVEDVAAGHETKLRWNESSDWIWSTEQTYEALVSSENFASVQAQMAAHARRSTTRKSPEGRRTYVLSGLVQCGHHEDSKQRRMQDPETTVPHYRCQYASEYALANKIDHPKVVYVRESAIVPRLDEWLARLFNPDNIDATVAAIVDARGPDDASEARAEAARQKLADCDDRLDKYRTALDTGADPAAVAGWMSEVQWNDSQRRQNWPRQPGTPRRSMRCVVSLRALETCPECSQKPLRRTGRLSTPNSESASPTTPSSAESLPRPSRSSV